MLALALALLALGGCGDAADESSDAGGDSVISTDTDTGSDEPTVADPGEPDTDPGDGGDDPVADETPAWTDIELTDAVTGEKFRISDYAGQPVLLHSFAVW
jgi:hypothetical protein